MRTARKELVELRRQLWEMWGQSNSEETRNICEKISKLEAEYIQTEREMKRIHAKLDKLSLPNDDSPIRDEQRQRSLPSPETKKELVVLHNVITDAILPLTKERYYRKRGEGGNISYSDDFIRGVLDGCRRIDEIISILINFDK